MVMSDKQAQELTQLLEREHSFLRGQAYGLARKQEDAEDLYQETVVKAMRGFTSFKPDTNFRAWIGRIMLNTHINNYNRKKLATDISCDISSGECDSTIFHVSDDYETSSVSDSPEKVFFNNYVNGDLQSAVSNLQDAYKTPFLMFHVDGYAYEEISSMLNVPIGTVKSRIFRARKMLKEKVTSFN